jgi:hypothetical protein
MARTARSFYVAPDKNAVYFIRCRTNRLLILSPDQAGADAGARRVRYIEDLIRLYARHFAISVHAHAVTRCEIRLVLQSRPELIPALDDAEIARRWLSICPTLRRGGELSAEPSEEEIQALCKDSTRIAQIRRQLSDISWWMRLLQQRVAQFCNRADNKTGRFWQARFRAVLLLDAMSHLAALANVDLAAVRVRMGKPISASTFTSDVYRRKDLQHEIELQRGIVQSDSQGIDSNSAIALTEVLTDTPSDGPVAIASQAQVATTVCGDGRHLAPIFPCSESTCTATQITGWISQFRCSEESVLNMQLSDYHELLERTALGFQPDDPKLSSLNIPAVLSKLRLSPEKWVLLAGEFDELFSHVAGRLAEMDAYMPERGRQRAYVRPAARSLLRPCRT